ncbi:DUF308 domain-containing protein [Sphingomonas immobilis]|uniref:DUF308 domain-containing protein n=1 Tax=Sphingomonas immobilis TaxID=3063997 RepID=A0ABT9A3P0_9SPHN|nr:DUF308 domain-containing protein [Sphingomonas sp. CA1-15]MDO7844037.1 DUF308 domain-containing protein [Sphingomonas sp. CA1-15]
MNAETIDTANRAPAIDRTKQRQLRDYYAIRAAVAGAWVVAAFTIGASVPVAAAILMVAYPAWDAAANLIDAARNGGLARNPTQAINVAASTLTAVAVLAVIGDTALVLRVFGAWAILAGLMQLATGARRWKAYGAQWAMILSGAQSALAGGFFIAQSLGHVGSAIATVAGYAGFGAFYFLVSALWLTFRRSA